MAAESRNLLEVLRAELAFLKNGGYHHAPQTTWRPQLMFQDSPICLNFNSSQERKPCSECCLMQFVPRDQRNKKIPCRYIPLDDQGETVDFFYRYGTQEELETVVALWLKTTIASIERGEGAGKNSSDHPVAHVHAKFVREY